MSTDRRVTSDRGSVPGQEGAPAAPLDDDRLLAAVAVANVPTLLLVLVQLTGDRRWLGDRYRPSRTRGLGDNDTAGLAPDVQDEVRAAAVEAISAWGRGRPVAIPEPSPGLLVELLAYAMGEEVPGDYAAMIAHELGHDEPAPSPPPAVPEGFGVVIIGAGASGLCAAVRLAQMGVPYTVLERNDDVGGTWLDNRYPGCGVDTPSHLYSFSFARGDWSRYFASRDELIAYFRSVADDFDVRPNVRFGVEVTSARWQEDERRWVVEATDREGAPLRLDATFVISAVGAFNKPRTPDIPGLGTFEGPAPHTARWPEGLDLRGKRVGVVGNGASAMQLVPAVAGTAASVTLFQRSPQWASPFEKFQQDVPEGVRYLLTSVPLYRDWYRVRLAWSFNDRIHGALQRDPGWEFPERSINVVNDAHRRFLTRHIVSELGDRQDLLEDVLPTYPPFGKRMLLDNGWFRTLTRDDVTLTTSPVEQVRARSVLTADGVEHELDVLVMATGFDVVRFLAPMAVTGRGRTLEATWDGDDARAYLGMAVPDFPNFFTLYGPNTQFGHGGSLIFMIELQVHYLLDLLQQVLHEGIDAVDVRHEVHDEYNRRVDEAHAAMVWTHPGMDVYYRNSKGRVVVNNPFKVVDFWSRLRHADLGDFLLTPAREDDDARHGSAGS